MTQSAFIAGREAEWRWMEQVLNSGRKAFSGHAARFPSAYRRVVRDLNIARSEDFDPALTDRLDRLVREGHSRLYTYRRIHLSAAADFLAYKFPQTVRTQWKLLTAFTVLFAFATLAAALLTSRDIRGYAEWFSPETAANMESMYNPDSGHFLTPRDVQGDADMFGFYIYNNISIAFQTFAGGILAGAGSLLYMLYNAAFFGATAAYLGSLGYHSTFYSFVCGHGMVELAAIIFSAAAGWRIGLALIRPPGRLSRRDGLKKAAGEMLPILYGAALMLVLAAVIEAFWSSRAFPSTVKYVFGGVMAVMLLTYFLAAGRNRENGDAHDS